MLHSHMAYPLVGLILCLPGAQWSLLQVRYEAQANKLC